MRLIFIALVICLASVCCKKEQSDVTSFWQCNKEQRLDSIAVVAKLGGGWIWRQRSCPESNKIMKADKDIQVNINANSSFNITQNSTIILQGNWKIRRADASAWKLELTTPSEYLNGRLLFCDSRLLFNNSYIDGCDNLFNRPD